MRFDWRSFLECSPIAEEQIEGMVFVREVVRCCVVWGPVLVTVNGVIGSVASVKGRSMQPTLNDGAADADTQQDLVLLDKFSIKSKHNYIRGDVVTLQSPTNPNETLIKRIIGIEGDWILDRAGNYRLLARGQCWVEGDNQQFSQDSDHFGPVPLGLIQARVRAVVWPPNHMQIIKNSVDEKRLNQF